MHGNRLVIQVNRSALIAKVLKVPCQVQVSDLMSLYPAFQKYERNGVSAELVSSNSQNLSAETLQWAYALCKKNMQVPHVSLNFERVLLL